MEEPTSTQVIVLDDDPCVHEVVAWMLRGRYQTHAVHTAEELDRLCERVRPDVVLLDWQLQDCNGLDLIREIHRRLPTTPVVLVTAHSSPEVAARSIKSGAFDFLPKPLDEARLVATMAQAAEHGRLARRLAEVSCDEDGESSFEGILGVSPQIRRIRELIRSVAPTDASVMIFGESGVGKELVAHAVHRRSRRSDGPFVALNMAALPGELVESTLFGHEKGAFTGADRRRAGACEEARGGTLFLDEISEMPLDLQAKLLRFLQEKTYRRVGAENDQAADVRVLSATNRDPQELLASGRIRADLYYRLNVVPIVVPPLRDRGGDIELLVVHALRRYSGRYGKRFESVDPQALELLRRYGWPGNVRELMHMIERIVVLADGPRLEIRMLPAELDTAGVPASAADAPAIVGGGIRPLADVERRAIEHALRVCGGSVPRAARGLGVSEATIYRKLKAYGRSGAGAAA
jgi:two-component system, repressor protein LuxO